jgi:hypothetical protein
MLAMFKHVWGEVSAMQNKKTGEWVVTRQNGHSKTLSHEEFMRLYVANNRVGETAMATAFTPASDINEEDDADGVDEGNGFGPTVEDELPGPTDDG